LDRERFTPLVVFLKAGPFAEEVASVGIDTVVIPTRRARYLHETVRAIWLIRRLIRKRQVDLVFGNMAMGHIYGGLAALRTQARAVWFEHVVVERPDLVTRLAASIPASRVYVNSQATRTGFQRVGSHSRVEQIVLGIDLSNFHPARILPGNFRREFSVPRHVPLLVTVGHFWPGKGHVVVLEAFLRIIARFPEARLILAGGEPPGRHGLYTRVLQQSVTDMGLDDRVIFTGCRGDMAEVLRDADLLLHGAVSPEGFGLALLEAMAMGVPVVATRVGATEELVVEGQTGYLAPPGNAEVLAELALYLLSNPDRRVLMGKAGRRRAEEMFSDGQMISAFEQSFERVLADGSR
jgi:glycosyltransferase involved in cell wall biosynthesis